jgi:hypothetical protein
MPIQRRGNKNYRKRHRGNKAHNRDGLRGNKNYGANAYVRPMTGNNNNIYNNPETLLNGPTGFVNKFNQLKLLKRRY